MPGFAETFGYMLLALACLASAAGLYWAWHTLEVPPKQNKAKKVRWSDLRPRTRTAVCMLLGVGTVSGLWALI